MNPMMMALGGGDPMAQDTSTMQGGMSYGSADANPDMSTCPHCGQPMPFPQTQMMGPQQPLPMDQMGMNPMMGGGAPGMGGGLGGGGMGLGGADPAMLLSLIMGGGGGMM